MKFSRRQLLVIIMVVLLCGIAVYFGTRHKTEGSENAGNTSGISSQPPPQAIDVVTRFLSARENALGANQSSPSSWTQSVKSIMTPELYAKLQPSATASTGSTPYNYQIAHQQGWTIKATVTGCFWNKEAGQGPNNSGSIYCNLTDSTVDQNGTPVPSSALPFGWVYSGDQPPATLTILNQNGSWLVSDDTTGQSY